ncbi:Ankyrin-1 [Monoraphidium neglectum]|uniref:Ankyrin-1 n=1 Tax=Monoraphidium neglectum TaxID=145388 RepID=A0A0D2K7R0_9CHLO|nr:Ankyrin-1 [Monoraphidium neglectum]KIZ06263.1 Ankyrin-1 [Monoraphidium neglectum]|eukprot:XP_013905282.1 Ankyrin-1 [Monoraphidium neglectum]
MTNFSLFPALKHNQADDLRKAAAEGNVAWIARILSGRTPADPKKKEHTSALQMASRNGHMEAARVLVAKGADVNRISPDGTALMDAAAFGHEEIVRFLLENKADAQLGVDGDLPAHRAARSGHAAVLRILEQLPGGPEALLAPNADGKTPLMLVSALQEGGAEAAAFLMERGADPCAADKAGSTALHTAATSGNAPVARLLLATLHGEQLASAANVQGRTPLHLAALFGHEGVVRALMERKADVSAADQDGCTPLHMLCKSLMIGAEAQVDVARAIIASGADPSARDGLGRSCADYAAGPALQQLLAGGVASTSRGAGEQLEVRASPKVVSLKQGPSKKELLQEALQEGLATSGVSVAVAISDGEEVAAAAGPEAFLIKQALRKHTSEEPDGWKLGSEVAPQ